VAYRTGPIQRLIDEGGTIVEREIKPSLPDLVYAKVTPEEFRNYASGWHAGLDRARVRFDACAAPARLGRAKTLYDEAMRQYVQAVDAFSAASRAPDVKGALSAATPVADHADATWDRADKLVVSELKRLGLPERPPRPAGVQPPCQG